MFICYKRPFLVSSEAVRFCEFITEEKPPFDQLKTTKRNVPHLKNARLTQSSSGLLVRCSPDLPVSTGSCH